MRSAGPTAGRRVIELISTPSGAARALLETAEGADLLVVDRVVMERFVDSCSAR